MLTIRSAMVAVVVAMSTGCVGPNLPAQRLACRLSAQPSAVFEASRGELLRRGYREAVYLGNDKTAVWSKTEDTFWTGPAGLAGMLSLPFFIVTWPIAWIVADRNDAVFWPLWCNAWEMETHRTSVITLTAVAVDGGVCAVSVEVRSPAKAAHRDAEAVMRAMGASLGEQLEAESAGPSEP